MTFSPDAEFPVINIEKGRLEGHFHASFQASEAMPRLVKAEAGIKANVVPGKAREMQICMKRKAAMMEKPLAELMGGCAYERILKAIY